MLAALVECLWVGGGAGLTVLLAGALLHWIRQELRARSKPDNSGAHLSAATDTDDEQHPPADSSP